MVCDCWIFGGGVGDCPCPFSFSCSCSRDPVLISSSLATSNLLFTLLSPASTTIFFIEAEVEVLEPKPKPETPPCAPAFSANGLLTGAGGVECQNLSPSSHILELR